VVTGNEAGLVIMTIIGLLGTGIIVTDANRDKIYYCETEDSYRVCDSLSNPASRCYYFDDSEIKHYDICSKGLWEKVEAIPENAGDPIRPLPIPTGGDYTLNSDGTCNVAGSIAKEFRGILKDGICVAG